MTPRDALTPRQRAIITMSDVRACPLYLAKADWKGCIISDDYCLALPTGRKHTP